MTFEMLKLERDRVELGPYCDRKPGPLAMQLTVRNPETGVPVYCICSEYEGEREYLAADRDLLTAVCSFFEEDILEHSMERYRMDHPLEAARIKRSVYLPVFDFLSRHLFDGEIPQVRGMFLR